MSIETLSALVVGTLALTLVAVIVYLDIITDIKNAAPDKQIGKRRWVYQQT